MAFRKIPQTGTQDLRKIKIQSLFASRFPNHAIDICLCSFSVTFALTLHNSLAVDKSNNLRHHQNFLHPHPALDILLPDSSSPLFFFHKFVQ